MKQSRKVAMSPLECRQQLERQWRAYRPGAAEPDWAAFLPDAESCTPALLEQLIQTDIEYRVKNGLPAMLAVDYFARAKLSTQPKEDFLRACLKWELHLRRNRGDVPQSVDYYARFPDVTMDQSLFPESHSPAMLLNGDEGDLPSSFGRYRVLARLEKGGFGVVYRGLDEVLQRPVAIKVPHRTFTRGADDGYVVEARILASLDHPHIVPVFDVEHLDDGRLIIVSKFIDGQNLAERLRSQRPDPPAVVRLIATLAEALHYAHLKGLVHRDIKPANILIDTADRPYLVDFGLALREEDFGKGPQGAGTIQYMSPEQARNEGHRVDGRSDIFSLGVVLYESLTGRRPFQGDTTSEILDQIATVEPRPLRQIHDTILKELERICLKALAKPASQRYTTARDMADDLNQYLNSANGIPANVQPAIVPASPPTKTETSRQDPVIVPKGLRSFDAGDASFFTELIPGPRDRDGVPECLRFWRQRIERSEDTFSVGLIYGPSGCGKSSLVKAGLLPLLPIHIDVIYIEAAPGLTEERLLTRLRKLHPQLPASRSLSETLTALRRGTGMPQGRKLLLVIDQFEQWLHTRSSEPDCELVRALRQCDGERLKALLLVRDDFWMAITRLMSELDIRIVEGENAAGVDLFDERHARKVLTLLGRAHGALPPAPEDLSPEQCAFVERSVAELNQGGKLIPVRLALFSEMVKSQNWVTTTLDALGGIEGLGGRYLEETFAAETAPARIRRHQTAARAVLGRLLPELGNNIKGLMRSRAELLETSGYSQTPLEFEDLLNILHREIRLISPVDPQGSEPGTASSLASSDSARHYQLTHDYLVPALRDWLNRKQKETRRGRAELLLAERAALYQAQPRRRNLPSLLEWCIIRRHVPTTTLPASQRTLIRRADRHYLRRALAALAVALLLGVAAWQIHGELRADTLHAQLLEANLDRVPALIQEMAPYRRWAVGKLKDSLGQEQHLNSQQALKLRLALLPVEATQADILFDQLMTAEPAECKAIVETLVEHDRGLRPRLDAALAARRQDAEGRLRSLACLAKLDRSDPRWPDLAPNLVNQLMVQSPYALAYWCDLFRPIGPQLFQPMADRLDDVSLPDTSRRMLTRIYREYAIVDATADSHLRTRATWGIHNDQKSSVLIPKANLAAALVAIDRGDAVWADLRHSALPTYRSLLIERFGPCGVEAVQLERQLEKQTDSSIRVALILALGEVPEEGLPQGVSDRLTGRLLALFENDPHPGVHSAAEWVLRKWGRGKDTDAVVERLRSAPLTGMQSWRVNPAGLTLAMIRGRHEYLTHRDGKIAERATVDMDIAMATREVTIRQFKEFDLEYLGNSKFARSESCPAVSITWEQAAQYCNWLSDRERLEHCYVKIKDEKNMDHWVPASDWPRRNGYRLPTFVECQIASQAGASTRFACGDAADDLLVNYAIFKRNSLFNNELQLAPVGSCKPSDFGHFDLLGNAAELCNDSLDASLTALDQHRLATSKRIVYSGSDSHVVSGGSFEKPSFLLIEASTTGHTTRSETRGFRPVRNLTEDERSRH